MRLCNRIIHYNTVRRSDRHGIFRDPASVDGEDVSVEHLFGALNRRIFIIEILDGDGIDLDIIEDRFDGHVAFDRRVCRYFGNFRAVANRPEPEVLAGYKRILRQRADYRAVLFDNMLGNDGCAVADKCYRIVVVDKASRCNDIFCYLGLRRDLRFSVEPALKDVVVQLGIRRHMRTDRFPCVERNDMIFGTFRFERNGHRFHVLRNDRHVFCRDRGFRNLGEPAGKAMALFFGIFGQIADCRTLRNLNGIINCTIIHECNGVDFGFGFRVFREIIGIIRVLGIVRVFGIVRVLRVLGIVRVLRVLRIVRVLRVLGIVRILEVLGIVRILRVLGIVRVFRVLGIVRVFRVLRIVRILEVLGLVRILEVLGIVRILEVLGIVRILEVLRVHKIPLDLRIIRRRGFLRLFVDHCIVADCAGSGIDRNHVFRGCIDVQYIIGKRCEGQQLQHHDDRNKDRQGTSAEKDSGQL